MQCTFKSNSIEMTIWLFFHKILHYVGWSICRVYWRLWVETRNWSHFKYIGSKYVIYTSKVLAAFLRAIPPHLVIVNNPRKNATEHWNWTLGWGLSPHPAGTTSYRYNVLQVQRPPGTTSSRYVSLPDGIRIIYCTIQIIEDWKRNFL
jgi:hypothetical protein